MTVQRITDKFISITEVVSLLLVTLQLTGCSSVKLPSDSELVKTLSESLGTSVEMISAPEGTGDGAYKMKSADGTEFTVKRIRQYNIMGTGGYYWYNCDYLAKWVTNHPELSNILNERNIPHEDFGNGILVYAAAFDDIRAAVKTACELVESPSNYLPSTTEFDGDYQITIPRPKVLVEMITGETDAGQYETDLLSEIEFNSSNAVDYDDEMKIFLAERACVDDVRKGHIDMTLPTELFEKYGPPYLKVSLNGMNTSLNRIRNDIDHIPVGSTETLYDIVDCNYTTESSILEFKTLEQFAACAGFHKSHADSENYVLTRDNENIAFHFSSDDCYAERNGARVSIQGEITQSSGSSVVELTTNDLTDLFGIEFEFDYTNGVANIVNQTDS